MTESAEYFVCNIYCYYFKQRGVAKEVSRRGRKVLSRNGRKERGDMHAIYAISLQYLLAILALAHFNLLSVPSQSKVLVK